jgi:phosphoglucosamine mutase
VRLDQRLLNCEALRAFFSPAFLTDALDADFGVMISASHNPMPDNGIKFFGWGGQKLDDAAEDQIEQLLGKRDGRPTGGSVGRVIDDAADHTTYVDHLIASSSEQLHGLTVVLDGANGAAHAVGPEAFARLGATVVSIHDAPDGLNINENCGSTHLGDLQKAVVAHNADVGFAFDGDADRCLAVDSNGEVVDGDQILAILALAGQEAGWLASDTVVATVMSNLGFLQAMEQAGIRVEQTAVGDRYVLEAMRAGGFTLGGEQSGHVILSQHASTGDGVLTAIHIAARMAQKQQPLAQLAGVMTRLPQVLVNVPDVDKSRACTDPGVSTAVQEAETALAGTGRILLRPSGTEPLVRVMVEAPTEAQARQTADHIAAVVRANLAL